MIVDLCESTKQSLIEYQSFKEIKNQIETINEVNNAIVEILRVLNGFRTQFSAIAGNIDHDDKTDIENDCEQMANIFSLLKSDFEQGEYGQIRKIARQSEQLETIQKELDEAWETSAKERIDPIHNLLRHVHNLPEIQQQLEEITRLKYNLEEKITSPPKNKDELEMFENDYEQINNLLKNLQGLTESIQKFLQEVIAESFTLADLTDEIIEWRKPGDRGKTFKVKF